MSAEYSMPCGLLCFVAFCHTYTTATYSWRLCTTAYHMLFPSCQLLRVSAFFSTRVSMVFPWLKFSSPGPTSFRWFSLSVSHVVSMVFPVCFPRTSSLLEKNFGIHLIFLCEAPVALIYDPSSQVALNVNLMPYTGMTFTVFADDLSLLSSSPYPPQP